MAARRQAQFLRLRAAAGQALDGDGKLFAWQHDPEAISGGEYTIFDDESGGNLLGSSRVVTVRLDLGRRVATLVKSDDQPEGQVAPLMGNARPRRVATSSSAGARCPTSRSSARQGSCCSTPSSRPGSAPTAPTCCPGPAWLIVPRLADRARGEREAARPEA